MAVNLALLIGPTYNSDLPTYIGGPLEGVENDLQLMKGMLCRNGFLLENIKVCCYRSDIRCSDMFQMQRSLFIAAYKEVDVR